MSTEHPEQEPGLTPHPPTYPVDRLEEALGAPINPEFEPHIIGRDESRSFGKLEQRMSGAIHQIGLAPESGLEAFVDLTQNRLRQLTGSIWLRERALMRRLLGDEAAEQGEMQEDAIGGLTDSEKAAYVDSSILASDELDYSAVKVQMEHALSTGIYGRRMFGVRPDRYMYYLPLHSATGEPAGMQLETVNLAAHPVTRRTEAIYFTEPGSPGHDPAADAERNQLEASLLPEIETVWEGNLIAFRYDLSEANRRLDVLSGLDDLKLRSAVLNGTGLDELFPVDSEEAPLPDQRSWE